MPLETAAREQIERQENGLAFYEARGDPTRCSIPPIWSYLYPPRVVLGMNIQYLGR
jgi:hypothetical protein